MYLRFTKALVFTSGLTGFKSAQPSRSTRGPLLEAPKTLLQGRQETLDPVRSDCAPHSVVFLTTTVFESQTSTGSSSQTSSSKTPDRTSGSLSSSSPALTSSTPISTSLEKSSTRTSITITSIIVPSASDAPSTPISSSTSTNPTSPPPPLLPPPSASSSKGKIAGLVVGAVFGLIFLGILIYTLFAWSRGINVCNCFGSCCGKDDDDDSRRQLPSRRDDTYPYADLGAETGYGYFRAARPVRDVPLPLLLPQQVAENHRTAWVQRSGEPVRAS